MPHGPLILGATGQIGRMLRACAAEVWDVEPIWQSRRADTQSLRWDILNDSAPDVSCSGIIMLAGRVSDPAKVHIALAKAACDLGERLGVRVLIASSQAVYGAAENLVSETSPCAPVSEYGRAKLAMEQSVAGRSNVCCLRIGNVVGADQLMQSAATGRVALDQWEDGTGPSRAMIGPVSLGAAFAGLMRSAEVPPILNLAQPGVVSMQSLVEETGAELDWVRAGPNALHRLELDVSAAQALVSLDVPSAARLVAEARQCGWPFS